MSDRDLVWRRPMVSRDVDEPHRASTPLAPQPVLVTGLVAAGMVAVNVLLDARQERGTPV